MNSNGTKKRKFEELGAISTEFKQPSKKKLKPNEIVELSTKDVSISEE